MSDDAAQSALNILNESKSSYSSVLNLFQQNHHLCSNTSIFSENFKLQLDQCAYSFRSLALLTVDLSGVVSKQWIGRVIRFYGDLPKNTHSHNVSQLKLLGGQAKKLSLVFKVIAEWSRDLSGRVGTALEMFKKEDLNSVMEGLSLGFPGGVIILIQIAMVIAASGMSGALAAMKATVSGQSAQQQVDKDLENIKNVYDSQTVPGKMKIVYKVSTNLKLALDGMNRICESLGAYWTAQADTFKTVGGKMVANEAKLPQAVLNKTLRLKNIFAWIAVKKVFLDYSEVMNRIICLYNISPASQPLPTTTYNVAELNFELTVPSSVDVAGIMGELDDGV